MKRRGDGEDISEEVREDVVVMEDDHDRSAKRLTLMFRRCVSGVVWFVLTIVLLDCCGWIAKRRLCFGHSLVTLGGYIWFPTDGPQLVEVKLVYRRVRHLVTRV